MASLHILKGPGEGTVVSLEGERFLLGRNADCQIVIPLTPVSRVHAAILRCGEQYFIEDKQSRNGTFVNNQAIQVRTQLKDNDRIRICDFIAAFIDPVRAESRNIARALMTGAEEAGSIRVESAVLRQPLEEECLRIRALLETNHVFYDRAEENGFDLAVRDPDSRISAILRTGFHRLCVLDAASALDGAGLFRLERFLRYAQTRMVQVFDLALPGDRFHAENIAQVLKDEPRSLFCFVNVQLVPIHDLHRLRGFTQDGLHQALFLCCGRRRLSREEEDAAGDAGSSIVDLVVQPGRIERDLLSLCNSWRSLQAPEQLYRRIADDLFSLFTHADRFFLIRAEGDRLIPRVLRTRQEADESTARFSRALVRRCLETSAAFLSNDAGRDEHLTSSSGDARMRSVMCVPLCRADGKAFGIVQLDTAESGRMFTQDDLRLLTSLAVQIASILEMFDLREQSLAQERMQRDLSLARHVQESFRAAAVPEVPGYEFFGFHEPSQTIGGDLYDFVPLNRGKIAILVGDVAGRGMAAALVMSRVVVEARYCLQSHDDLAEAMTRLNDLFTAWAAPMDRFATLQILVLDPASHQVTLCSAGHVPPLLYRHRAGSVEIALPTQQGGPPLGLLQGVAYDTAQVVLEPGDCLLSFTDGVIESTSASHTYFSLERASAALQPGGTPHEIGNRLLAALRDHTAGCPPLDDWTLVCLGRLTREEARR